MKYSPALLILPLLFIFQPGHAEVSCPAPQSLPPEGIGVSYLMVCNEVPDFDAKVATDLLATLSSDDRYTPESFNTFRDAAAFDWKNPIILWNKQQIKTRPSPGFVTLKSGEVLSGDLQLKVVKGVLDEIKLDDGKKEQED